MIQHKQLRDAKKRNGEPARLRPMRNQDIDNHKKKYGGTVALANDVGDYTIDQFAHLDAAMRPCLQCHQRAGDAVVPVGVGDQAYVQGYVKRTAPKGAGNHDWLAVGLSSLAMELQAAVPVRGPCAARVQANSGMGPAR